MNVLMIGGTGPSGIPIVRAARRPRPRRHDPAPRHARASGDAARRRAHPRRPVRRGLVPRRARRHRRGTSIVAMYGRLRMVADGDRRPLRPLRVGRRRARVPRLDERVAARARRAAGSGRRGRAARSTIPRSTRRATASSAPRRRCSPRTRAPRTSAIRTSTVRTSRRRASGRSSGASSTAGAASSSPTTASRCTTTATPRTARPRSCSAIEHPERSAGTIFNVGDEEVLTIRQVVELCAIELGADLEIVSMPYDLAVPAWPLLAQPLPTHRVLDLTRLHHQLGHRDVVPAREAVGRTARWLAEHPPDRGGLEETGAHRSRSTTPPRTR